MHRSVTFINTIIVGQVQMYELYLNVDDPLIVAVAVKGMGMIRRLPFNRSWCLDASPSQLLDSDESLVNVGVLGNEECAKMHGKLLGIEYVRGCLSEV